MTVKELFDFITDPTINESNMEEYLDKLMSWAAQRPALSNEEQKEDEIFKRSYIPYTMNEVVDFERDFRRAKQGQPLIYTTLHGIMPDLSKPRDTPEILRVEEVAEKQATNKEQLNDDDLESEDEEEGEDDSDDDEEEEDDEESDEDGDEDGDEDESSKKKSKINMEIHIRPRDESPNSKKVKFLEFFNV